MTDHTAQPIEGYAALFGIADLEGDVVRAGAFRSAQTPLPMLVRHDPRLVAGAWTELVEDARGLFVRGVIRGADPAGFLALRLAQRGVDGLSIGFRTLAARKIGRGRELAAVDLVEISIVPSPMAPLARFARVTSERTIA